MKKKLKNLWQDKFCNAGLKISFLFLLLTSLLLIFSFHHLPLQIPLFYSLPWGEEQLAKPIFLSIFPLGILIVSLLNTAMTIFLFEKDFFLPRILIWTNVLISFISSVAILKIIILII